MHGTRWRNFAPAIMAATLIACGGDVTPPDHAPADTGANADRATGSAAAAPPAQPQPVEGTAVEGAVDTGAAAQTRPVLAIAGGATPYLTDAAGAAVYYMEGNRDGNRCDADCERAWPPVVANAGQAQAAQGVDGGAISNITRADNGLQVAYDGMPLYRYAGDQGPGRTSGDGVKDKWGQWRLAKPANAAR